MKLVDQSSTTGHDVTQIRTALARWYADHSSIRHLWAIEEALALVVLVTLEPTSDGDDTLPVWLAKQHDWANDLRLLTRREVHLTPMASGVFRESSVDIDAATIAKLSWRDAWESP